MTKYISLFFLIMTFISRGQSLNINSNCTTNPPDFIHLSYEQANEAVNSEDNLIGRGAEKVCPEYIANLVNELREGNLSNGNKTLAIYLLGILHTNDTNAINILIENIDFRTSKIEPNLRPVRWKLYPAEDALIKIGKTVIDPILNHLPNETSRLRRQLMCEVLRKIIQRNP